MTTRDTWAVASFRYLIWPLSDSAETLGRVLVVILEFALGVLAILYGRRRTGVWRVLLTVVGLVLLLLATIGLFT
jgi:peptidoglycan/LPS O-acetylase OafA/YrhL